jgi:hypothetical protein
VVDFYDGGYDNGFGVRHREFFVFWCSRRAGRSAAREFPLVRDEYHWWYDQRQCVFGAWFSGMFSFTDTALATGQQNLLSGIFQFDDTGAQLNESMGGTGGGFGASDTAIDFNQLVMTSSYINFTGQTLQTGTFTLSSLAPSFSAGGHPTFRPVDSAAGVGTFSSSQGLVPEPETFILIGAGLVGLGLLRRGKG